MKTDLRNFRDADGIEAQPYMAAYMIERGYRTLSERWAKDGNNAPYMIWNGERWREFARENKLSTEGLSRFHADAFLVWLTARASSIGGAMIAEKTRLALAS